MCRRLMLYLFHNGTRSKNVGDLNFIAPQIKPQRSHNSTQSAITPARGAPWLKSVLEPGSCKPVFIASHTPPSPHNDITSSSERSTPITTTARPGGPSRLCCGGLLLLYLVLLLRVLHVCRHISVHSSFVVCRPPLFCPSIMGIALPDSVMFSCQ